MVRHHKIKHISEHDLLLFTGRHFGIESAVRKTWWQQEFVVFKCKAAANSVTGHVCVNSNLYSANSSHFSYNPLTLHSVLPSLYSVPSNAEHRKRQSHRREAHRSPLIAGFKGVDFFLDAFQFILFLTKPRLFFLLLFPVQFAGGSAGCRLNCSGHGRSGRSSRGTSAISERAVGFAPVAAVRWLEVPVFPAPEDFAERLAACAAEAR